MSKPNGGPAFPMVGRLSEEEPICQEGMSLRDYFAAKALQGLLAMNTNPLLKDKDIAKDAFAIADAMIAEREK